MRSAGPRRLPRSVSALLAALAVAAVLAGLLGPGERDGVTPAPLAGPPAERVPEPGSRCAGRVVTVMGTPQADVLVGTAGADVIAGLSGRDVIRAGAGADVVCGGRGGDVLNLGAGNDVAYGGADGPEHGDRVTGAPGDDTVLVDGAAGADAGAGGHRDEVAPSDGDDRLVGGPSGDELAGGAGRDVVDGWGGDDMVDGGLGADRIDGGEGADLVDYPSLPGSRGVWVDLIAGTAVGAGRDRLSAVENVRAGSGADVLLGDGRANLLSGGAGADRLAGRGGADQLAPDSGIGQTADDVVSGGAGVDLVTWSFGTDGSGLTRRHGVLVDLQAGAATGFGDDALAGIESVIGSVLADVLRGDRHDNSLYGGDGADLLIGLGGADAGAGGDGDDRCMVEASSGCER